MTHADLWLYLQHSFWKYDTLNFTEEIITTDTRMKKAMGEGEEGSFCISYVQYFLTWLQLQGSFCTPKGGGEA